VCQEDSASLLIPKCGEGVERRAAVQALAANLDRGRKSQRQSPESPFGKGGVPVFDRGKKDPRVRRGKISAADFSRLPFSIGDGRRGASR
jgi:hypothetical protein